GAGSKTKKVKAIRDLRRLLSKYEISLVEAALKTEVIPALAQCLAFGSPDEHLLEASWCLTNIVAGEPEQTKFLLPSLPLLIVYLGEKSSIHVVEQCAWAVGNVAGEGEEMRNVLLSQGALTPLARMMLSNKGSTTRTTTWALSNLIKGPDPTAASELIKIDGVLDAIVRHLNKLATEVAWLFVYLSALSNLASSMLIKSNLVQLLVWRLETSDSLQLLIPVLRRLSNIIASDSHKTCVLTARHDITKNIVLALVKCLRCEHWVLKKEAAWVLSNIAVGTLVHEHFSHSFFIFLLLVTVLYLHPSSLSNKPEEYNLFNKCLTCPSQNNYSRTIYHVKLPLVEQQLRVLVLHQLDSYSMSSENNPCCQLLQGIHELYSLLITF
ncbi:hypothetical protein MKX01_021725, partial [Papaver californicum]